MKQIFRKVRFGIRARISLGFLVLAAMIFVSGALSMHEFHIVHKEINSLLHDSYRSVQFSQGMLTSLGNAQLATLNFMSSDSAERNALQLEFNTSQQEFIRYLELAENNLTHENEGALVDSVRSSAGQFFHSTRSFLKQEDVDLPAYTERINPLYLHVQQQVYLLLTLNQDGLYHSSQELEQMPRRAFRPGIVVMAVSVIFTLMFTFLISRFYVKPIVQLTDCITHYIKYHRHQLIQLQTNDELQDLRNAVERLIAIDEARRKRENAQ